MKKSSSKTVESKPEGTKNKEWRQEYQLLYRLCQVPELGWDVVNKAKVGDETALDAIWFYAVQGHRKSAVLEWVDSKRKKIAQEAAAKKEASSKSKSKKGKDAVRNSGGKIGR